MEKEYRKLSTLKNWEKNPRSIKEADFERLKKQLEELGEYKPLLITSDGTVLGGNMRLRAMKELGWDEVWVSVVEADTEEEKLKYALSDNDRAGFYDQDAIANMMGNFPELDWDMFSIDINDPMSMADLAKIGEGVGDFDRLEIITVEPPEAPVLKERVSIHMQDIEEYERVKKILGDNPREKLLALINAQNV